MRYHRTITGTVVSVTWLVVVGYLAFRDTSALFEMSPNEWGDFLAGCFAPLAFLWLVLGYFQQGEELRMSTEALRLQAEELKNSVDQQRQLVEVSRLQVESEREALQFERMLREDLSMPKFSVQSAGGSFHGDGRSTYNFNISNTGHDAIAFTALVQFFGDPLREVMSQPLFSKGSSIRGGVTRHTLLPQGDSFLLLRYTDGLGRPQECAFKISRENDDPHAGLKFERVDV